MTRIAGSPSPDAPADATSQGLATVVDRVVFLKQLQAATNRIHATDDLEAWQFSMAGEICDLVQAERMTLYELDSTGREIVSMQRPEFGKLKVIRLPLDERSVAGFVGATRQTLNIADAYDAEELRRIHARLKFHKAIDNFTGFRSRQMLVMPLVAEMKLVGVLQFVNFKGGGMFPGTTVDAARELGQTLAVALLRRRQRHFQQARQASLPLAALVSAGVLGTTDLEGAQQEARQSGRDLQDILVEERGVSLAQLGAALAQQFQVTYEPFKAGRPKPVELMRNLRREFAESSRWLPLEDSAQGLVVVAVDPDHTRSSKVVGSIFQRRPIEYRVTTLPEFRRMLKDCFGDSGTVDSIDELLSDMAEEEAQDVVVDDESAAQDNELVRLVNRVIVEAYQQGASDIHVEPRPGKGKTIIRLRRDGALVNYIEVPAAFRSALVTRIKIMCDLDIAEKRRPQDGKIRFRKFGPLDIELRVATLPTAGGTEDVVMRILAAGEPLPLGSIGLSPRNHRFLLECVQKPYGLFLVCGPTGSGKTTTLHSVLAHLNKPDTKIWTAEDPVEITQDGLRQVQVNRKAGLDFVAVMRAFLRADPDIIMVGEMRDTETANTGIEASLTGHLVMSTLHTNSAVESVVRLLDMGMEPFNFADALLGILAQRLARRLCTDCKEPYQPDAQEMDRLLDEYCVELRNTPAWQADPDAARAAVSAAFDEVLCSAAGPEALRPAAGPTASPDAPRGAAGGHRPVATLYRARGCQTCMGTGYKGRIGLHELLVATDPVKELIQARAKVPQILAVALSEGMRTLKMDGIEKVLQGYTDMHQVRSVCIK